MKKLSFFLFTLYYLTSSPSLFADYKAVIKKTISSSEFKNIIYSLSSIPHTAGTKNQKTISIRAFKLFKNFGLKPQIKKYYVLLSYPESIGISIENNYKTFSLRETPFSNDPYSMRFDIIPGYSAYSPSGEVFSEFVYANYGTKEDFEYLKKTNINLKGKIALIRLGKIFRGDKVSIAKKFGLKAVVLFPDPQDRGYKRFIPYPEGKGLPQSGIERGAILSPDYPGDPETPEIPSFKNSKRIQGDKIIKSLLIPTATVSMKTALEIFSSMRGKETPIKWQGGLPVRYRLTSGGVKLRLLIKMKNERRYIYDVIAKINGKDKRNTIVVGSHYDAWTFGTVDPIGGVGTVLLTAKFLSSLKKSGFIPEYTIVFALWDAEEFGMIGSTEWYEEVEKKGVNVFLNINQDGVVGGDTLWVSSTKGMQKIAKKVISKFVDDFGKENFTLKNIHPQSIGEINSGYSDHSASFYRNNSSVVAIGSTGGGLPVYHTAYDNIAYFEKFVDPNYTHGRDVSRILSGFLYLYLTGKKRFSTDELLYSIEERIKKLEVKKEYKEKILEKLKKIRGNLKEKIIKKPEITVPKIFVKPQGLFFNRWNKNILWCEDPENRYKSIFLPEVYYSNEKTKIFYLKEFENRIESIKKLWKKTKK